MKGTLVALHNALRASRGASGAFHNRGKPLHCDLPLHIVRDRSRTCYERLFLQAAFRYPKMLMI